jgi:hypothetical protein
MVLMNAPPAPFVPPEWHGRPVVAMTACFSGDPARAEEAIAPLRDLGDPVFDVMQEVPYTQQQSYLDGTEPKGHHYYWRTEFASGLSEEMLAALRDAWAACPVPMGQVIVAHLEGALNERAWDDGAVGNRDVRFAYGVASAWEPDDPRGEEYVAWARAAGADLRAFSTGSSYVNFQTPEDDVGRLRATYGPNWDRLVEVKRRYDPGNLFRSNRNIAPS